MSVYFKKGRGWRYDFTTNGKRHTEAWFETKLQAKRAEAQRREEVRSPAQLETRTDITFLDLVNLRLDHVKAYCSERHYKELVLLARRWAKEWGDVLAAELSEGMIQAFVLKRRKVSPITANTEIRYLKATFNHGIKKRFIKDNPLTGMDFFPVEKRVKYVPPSSDIDKVMTVAPPETRDYLCVIRETMARVSEVNRLTWDDVNLKERYVILYTRKKKGGHLTPRKIPMTAKLYEVLARRHARQDGQQPWVFWHEYISSKTGERQVGPYQDRKKIMRTLCKEAGVRYFRFHAFRHSGASVMENHNVPIGSIQRILGHENRSTTEIYLHSLGDSERAAMAVFEQATEKSHTESHTNKKGLRRKSRNPLKLWCARKGSNPRPTA